MCCSGLKILGCTLEIKPISDLPLILKTTIKPWSHNMWRLCGLRLMDRNRRKMKSLGCSRPGWEFFQLWLHNRWSPCSHPMFSIAARPIVSFAVILRWPRGHYAFFDNLSVTSGRLCNDLEIIKR